MVAGNHVLTPEHVARIEKDKIDVITGEFKSEMLYYYAFQSLGQPDGSENSLSLKDILYRLEHLGEGASPSEMRYHRETIKSLLRQGKTFVSADAMDPYQSSFDSKKPVSLYSIAEGGLIAGLIGPEVLYVSRKLVEKRNKSTNREQKDSKDGVTRRTILKWGALEYGIYLARKHIDFITKGADIPLLDATSSIDPFGLQIGYEELREKLGIDKHAFEVYSEELIGLRNKVMALNTWHTIALSARPDKKTAIMMMFGDAHIKTYDDFLKGPEALEKEIEGYARKICTDSIDFLINEANRVKKEAPGLIDNEERLVWDLWGYSEMFVDPYFYGRNQPLDESKVTRMPKTARAVFIKTLSEVISENERAGTKESQRKARILKGVKGKIINQMTHELDESEGANIQLRGKTDYSDVDIDERKRAEIQATFSNSYSDDIKEAEKEVSQTRKEKDVFDQGLYYKGLPLGIAFYQGRYHPVVRNFTVREDGIIETMDYLDLPNSHRLQLGKSSFRKAEELYREGEWFSSDTIRTLEVDYNPIVGPYYFEMLVRPNNGRLQGFPGGVLVTEGIEKNFKTNHIKRSQFYVKTDDGKADLLPIDLLLLTSVKSKD
jgi:hypothetical protein